MNVQTLKSQALFSVHFFRSVYSLILYYMYSLLYCSAVEILILIGQMGFINVICRSLVWLQGTAWAYITPGVSSVRALNSQT